MDRECPFVRPAGEERLGIKWSRAVSHRRPLNVQVVAASVLLVVNPDVMEARVRAEAFGIPYGDRPRRLAAAPARHRSVAAAAFGMGVLVRPTNALLLPAVLVAMPLSPAALGLLVLGGAPFAVFTSTYNYFTYGEMFNNGYGGSLQLGSS